MIKYLCVKRRDNTSKNGRYTTSLPFGLKSMEDINNADISNLDKLKLLTEQAILARYMLSMNDEKHKDLHAYLRKLKTITLTTLAEKQTILPDHKYELYVKSLYGLLTSPDATNFYHVQSLLEDQQNFSKEVAQIPRDFYIPYIASKGYPTESVYTNAVCLVPNTMPCEGGQCIAFSKMEFSSCDTTNKLSKKYNSDMEFLRRLSWDTKNWIQATECLQSFGCSHADPIEETSTVPGMLKTILTRKNHPSMDFKNPRRIFMSFLQELSNCYRIRIDSLESMQFLIDSMGYTTNGVLLRKDPSLEVLSSLESYSELMFLKPYKLRAAMEAAGDEDAPEDEPEDDEDDPLGDDPESDPEEDEGATDEESTDTDDETTGDTGDSDLGGEDELGGTDTGGDTGSGDSSDGTASQATDTVTEPEDPLSVIFQISHSETISDYFYRKTASSVIRSIVNNPPSNMSSETVAFLRVWLTQWINLVSVDTTKSILTQLAVPIDV